MNAQPNQGINNQAPAASKDNPCCLKSYMLICPGCRRCCPKPIKRQHEQWRKQWRTYGSGQHYQPSPRSRHARGVYCHSFRWSPRDVFWTQIRGVSALYLTKVRPSARLLAIMHPFATTLDSV